MTVTAAIVVILFCVAHLLVTLAGNSIRCLPEFFLSSVIVWFSKAGDLQMRSACFHCPALLGNALLASLKVVPGPAQQEAASKSALLISLSDTISEWLPLSQPLSAEVYKA